MKEEGVGAKADFNHLFHTSPWNKRKYSPLLSVSAMLAAVRDTDLQVSSVLQFTVQKET